MLRLDAHREQLVDRFVADATDLGSYFVHSDDDDMMALQIDSAQRDASRFGESLAKPPSYTVGAFLFSPNGRLALRATPFVLSPEIVITRNRHRGTVGFHESVARDIIDTIDDKDLGEARFATTELFPLVSGKIACRLIYFDQFNGIGDQMPYDWRDQQVRASELEAMRGLSILTPQIDYIARHPDMCPTNVYISDGLVTTRRK